MRKVIVIARQTVGEFARDRVFHAVVLFSVLFVFFSLFLSTLTIVESRKILLDFGLSGISIIGIVLGIYLGVTVVGREIERRTAYTILSKPVTRAQYLLGKFAGAAAVLAAVHVISLATLIMILWRGGDPIPPGIGASLYLMVLESVLLMALSLLCSLHFSSMFLAASISVAFFLLGRSNESFRVMAEKAEGGLRTLSWMAHKIFPSLDRFNIRELVAYGKPYPEGMIGMSTLYFSAYLLMLLCLSALVFRRKDLE